MRPIIDAAPGAEAWPRILPLLALLTLPALAIPEADAIAATGAVVLAALAFVLALARSPSPSALCALAAAGVAAPVVARLAEGMGPGVGPVAWGILAFALSLASSNLLSGSPVRRAVAVLLAASGTLVGARALWEVAVGLDAMAAGLRQEHAGALRDAIVNRLEQGRAYAGFVTPAAAGMFLAMGLAATAGLAAATRGRKRALCLAAALVQLAGLAATRSLTAAGALLLAGAAAAVLLSGRGRRLVLATAAGLVAVLAVAILWRGPAVLSLDHPESPWRLRAGNARVALEIAQDAPWAGVGPGGYAEAFPRYRREGDNESRHAHCLPLELAAEFGVPIGALLTLAFYGFFLGRFRSALATNEPVTIGLAVAAVAFGLHNLGDFTAWLPSVLWPALIVSGCLREVRSPASDAGHLMGARGLAFMAVLAASTVVTLGSWADEARYAAIHEGKAGAAEQAERAVGLAPWDPEAAMVLATIRLDDALRDPGDAARRAAALEASEAAVRLAPVRAGARALRARARLLDADAPGAFADLDLAAHLNPSRPDYRADRDAVRPLFPAAGP